MKRTLFIACLTAIAMTAGAQKLQLGHFSKVDIDGPYEVKISKADTCGVWMEASADLAKIVDINVEDNELNLSCKEKVYEIPKGSYLKVWVDLPDLEEIEAAGISTIVMQGRFNRIGKEFKVDLDDIASIKGLEVDADKCSVDLSDASNINLIGIFSDFELDEGGNSNADLDITAKRFKCEADGNSGFLGVSALNADIKMGGSSRGRVIATESLSVKLTGNSSLSYTGPNTLRIASDVAQSSKLVKKK